MSTITQKTDPIVEFWMWFQRNEIHLRNFQSHPEKYLDEILEKIRAIQAGFAVELETPKDGVINMTVSANGDKEIFLEVEEIVEKSPKLEGWQFIAFRQRISKEMAKALRLKTHDEDLDPSKMRFEPLVSEDGLEIIVYVRGVTEANYNQVSTGGLLILDNLLGEYDCVTKVRSYDFHNMPTDDDEIESLIPLLDIAEFVDNFHSKNQSK